MILYQLGGRLEQFVRSSDWYNRVQSTRPVNPKTFNQRIEERKAVARPVNVAENDAAIGNAVSSMWDGITSAATNTGNWIKNKYNEQAAWEREMDALSREAAVDPNTTSSYINDYGFRKKSVNPNLGYEGNVEYAHKLNK